MHYNAKRSKRGRFSAGRHAAVSSGAGTGDLPAGAGRWEPSPGAGGDRPFFQELIDGGWDAYEEATAHESEELRKEDREILQLQEQIRQLLDSEGQRQFDRYEDCLNCRMTSELDQAYLVGYQTAIRLLLMGILPADTLLARNARHEPEKEGEKT